MGSNVISVIVLSVCVSLIPCQNVFSWDNEVTHKDLSGYAANSSLLSKNRGDYLKQLGYNQGLDEVFAWQEKKCSITGIDYLGSVKEKNVTKYKLLYKLPGSLQTADIGVSYTGRDYEASWTQIDTDNWDVKETDHAPYGQKVFSFSCQINKTNMVYTYTLHKYNVQTKDWDFSKRIIGIINIADNALPVGFRQEFEINDSNASQFISNNFDYQGLSAIGVHSKVVRAAQVGQ